MTSASTSSGWGKPEISTEILAIFRNPQVKLFQVLKNGMRSSVSARRLIWLKAPARSGCIDGPS
jgi:hypothetical protein